MKQVQALFVAFLEGDLVQSPEHLGIGYMVANLRKYGFSASVVEVGAPSLGEAAGKIVEMRPLFVGMSITTAGIGLAGKLASRLKGESKTTMIHLCAGGPVPTVMGRGFFGVTGLSGFDSCVRGEGETAVVEIMIALARGAKVQGIKGVVLKEDERDDCHTPAPPLDELPWAARDQLERANKYPYLRVLSGRGCTSRCSFCNAPNAANNPRGKRLWRGRSPHDVVEELSHLNKAYNMDTFDFVDSTFDEPGGGRIGKGRIALIAEGIIAKGLKIYYNINTQACNWREEDKGLIGLLHCSGLEKVLIGAEAGNDRCLGLFGKRSNTADNARAIQLFREHDVYVAIGFIMFHPYLMWEDVGENAVFLKENIGHNLRRFCTRLELYPGTRIVRGIGDDGLLHPRYYKTLDPYAYDFRDAGIKRMAGIMASIIGAPDGFPELETPPLAFETFDITVHTYLSRFRRACGGNYEALAILEKGIAEIESERASLAAFNYELFMEVAEAARHGRDMPEGLRERVWTRFSEAIKQIKILQLRAGMALRRFSRGAA